jgi:hypothetical protein
MKRILSAALLLAASALALAQPIQQGAITTINSAPTASCTAGSCVVFDMRTQGTATVQVSGTYTASGGLSLQATTNGTTWVTVGGSGTFRRLSTGATTATITSGEQGVYQLSGDCVGAYACRITALGAVTGSATVSVLTSPAAAGGVANISGGAGDASASNQVTGNASLASIDGKLPSLASGRVPVTDLSAVAQGSTTSGQSGSLMQGAVTTAAPSYSTGQTSPLSLDTTGALRVNITAGAGSGGTASTVGSATPATATAIGGNDGTNMQVPRVADVDSGAGTQYAMVVSPRLSASGGAIELTGGSGAVAAGTLRVVAATDSPEVAGIGGVSDAAATQGSTGSVSAKLRTVTSQLNSIDAGIPAALGATTMSAAMPVTIATDDARIGIVTETAPASDTASSGLNGRLQRIAQNLTTLNTSVNADPNYTQAPGSAAPSRALAMGARSGANLVAMTQASASVPIGISTATTTQLVALASGQVIHVTSWDVVAGGTGTFRLVYGTGTNCGTGTTNLTGAYPFIANAGIAKGTGLGPVLTVPAGNALCAVTTAAVTMDGSLSYTQFTP